MPESPTTNKYIKHGFKKDIPELTAGSGAQRDSGEDRFPPGTVLIPAPGRTMSRLPELASNSSTVLLVTR